MSPHESALSADDALERLQAGHARFLAGTARFPTLHQEILADLTAGQHPYATILCCSDSRVPPELIFGAGLGELFVIRVAGNVMSPGVLASMQYAERHLGTPLFVVLGHTGCGAVAATVETAKHGARQPSRIHLLIEHIRPALAELDLELSPEALMERAVEANVRWCLQQIRATPEGQARRVEGKMKLVGALYRIESGRVEFLA